MSASDELQILILNRLIDDAGVHAIVGDRIYDGIPSTASYPCVSFGPSDYVPDDADCIEGRVETLQIDCWSKDHGRLNPVKRLNDAVKKALHEFEGELTENALVELRVTSVRAFRDPDEITAHGVVTVSAMVEEA